MTLTLMGVLVAEGTETELAAYTGMLLELLKLKAQHDKKKEEDEWLKQFGDLSLGDLMRREQEEDE